MTLVRTVKDGKSIDRLISIEALKFDNFEVLVEEGP
jgi:hypothetical protein